MRGCVGLNIAHHFLSRREEVAPGGGMPSLRGRGGRLLPAAEEAGYEIKNDNLEENRAKQLPASASSSGLSLSFRLTLYSSTTTATLHLLR